MIKIGKKEKMTGKARNKGISRSYPCRMLTKFKKMLKILHFFEKKLKRIRKKP